MIVDMHSQLVQLPGNGYVNDEKTLGIIKVAAEDGITHIIATPLYRNNQCMNEVGIEKYIRNLNVKLKKLDIPVTIFEGMEIVLYEKIVQDLKFNLMPLAGSNKYVFIRFQGSEIPPFTLNTFFEMQLMGYIPVIANINENKELVKNTKKIKELVEKGALVHVGASSILGKNGWQIRRKMIQLCREGLVHFISTASGDSKNGHSLLKPAYEYLEKKLSADAVEYFASNAKSVIGGTDFHIEKFKRVKRQR